MNTCESAIKVVTSNRRKWLLRLSQNGNRDRKIIGLWIFVTNSYPSAESRHLTQYYSRSGTWKPCILLRISEELTVRKAHGSAGLRCRKKRMPSCNEVDTGFNVTRHESEQTSDGFFIAREFGEPPLWRKANDSNG